MGTKNKMSKSVVRAISANDDANEIIDEEENSRKTISQKTDTVGKLAEVMKKKLEQLYESSSNVERGGNVIRVPSFMTFRDAAKALVDWEKRMEEDTEKTSSWIGHPDDLYMAMYNGLQDAFGNVVGTSIIVGGFFGPRKIAAQTVRVKTDFDETVTVPVGAIKLPGVPININMGVRPKTPVNESQGQMHFEYKNKYGPLVERIEKCITERLEKDSIFKKKALNSRFEFVNPASEAVNRLVYSRQEQRDIETHIFQPIKNTAMLQKRGVSLKRTVLLCGRFGTGKTLTALKAAQVCLQNGWTFMNVVPGDSVEDALNFARKYEPCLVFFEDIDQVTGGERDMKLNSILNTIDGALSKNAKIMTILTTNNTDTIEKAMLRPGRIDAIIEMGNIDEGSFKGIIEAYCNDILIEPVDTAKLMPVAIDYTPSFIAEACNRAVMYAMSRNGHSDTLVITNDDLFDSLGGLRPQYDLMIKDRIEKPPQIENILKKMVNGAVDDSIIHVEDELDTIKGILKRIDDNM